LVLISITHSSAWITEPSKTHIFPSKPFVLSFNNEYEMHSINSNRKLKKIIIYPYFSWFFITGILRRLFFASATKAYEFIHPKQNLSYSSEYASVGLSNFFFLEIRK
jgi:hypothetical protein